MTRLFVPGGSAVILFAGEMRKLTENAGFTSLAPKFAAPWPPWLSRIKRGPVEPGLMYLAPIIEIEVVNCDLYRTAAGIVGLIQTTRIEVRSRSLCETKLAVPESDPLFPYNSTYIGHVPSFEMFTPCEKCVPSGSVPAACRAPAFVTVAVPKPSPCGVSSFMFAALCGSAKL